MNAALQLRPATHPALPAQPQSGHPLPATAASAWACLRQPMRAQPERGVVLLVALVMLLLVTVLGLTSARMLTMEERMAANSFDRNLAFQAAETALREGEALAEVQSLAASGPHAGFPAQATDCRINLNACTHGLCSTPSPPSPDCNAARWEDPTFAAWQDLGAGAAGAVSPLATGAPQFFVEYLGSTFPCDPQNPTPLSSSCVRYRITARSHDPAAPAAQGRANVVLQSIYAGLGGRAAANPPAQFIPEIFAAAEAAQSAGNNPSGPDSSQDDPETQNNGNNDAEAAINADHANTVRGRISWREIIPR